MAPQQSSTTMSTSVEHVHPVILWTAGDHSEVERRKQNNCFIKENTVALQACACPHSSVLLCFPEQ